jgi:selenide,water dikinase
VGPADLTEIMQNLDVPADPRVVVGVRTSDDAGVMEIPGSDQVLIQTVDFITPVCDDPYLFGRVAAANSLSDIYAMGGRPISALNVCCFPHQGPTKQQYAEILRGGLDVLRESGTVLLGGQTVKNEEIKYGMAVTGMALKSQLTPNSGARAGDLLVLTKPIGTGVLVGGVKTGAVSEAVLLRAVRKMAELNRAGCEAMVAAGCRGATDITGFGLAGHGWEMASASGVRLVFEASKVPVYAEAESVLAERVRKGELPETPAWAQGDVETAPAVPPARRHLFADPQTSGGLLIAVAQAKVAPLLSDLRARGVADAAVVGRVEAGPPSIQILA